MCLIHAANSFICLLLSLIHQFLGKRVVELGCGPGLCSVAAGLAGASDVIATDGDDKSVQLTALNISQNDLSSTTRAIKLFWGDFDDLRAVQSAWRDDLRGMALVYADFIIASDVAACPYAAAYISLLETMTALSGPETTVLLACQKRHSSENEFFNMMKEKFDVVRCVWSMASHVSC
jgi:ribosomal protein L11 methylase PrmA